MLRRKHRWWDRRKGSRGAALTEFAIMVPVIVLILWFAIYFWEVIHVRLKLQEATRFATWEFTAYPLHDYGEGTGSRFDEVEGEITDLTLAMYADLDSSDREAPAGGPVRENSFLATGWDLERVRIRESEPPDVTGEFLSELALDVVLMVEAWIESLLTSIDNPYAVGPVLWTTRSLPSIDRRWGFNNRGWVTTQVQIRVYNLMVPERFRDITSLRFEQDRWVRRRLRLTEEAALLADSWRLNDGSDVRHGDTDGGYYEQVDRIFLLNRDRASLATTAMEAVWLEAMLCSLDADIPRASEPVLVSLSHHRGEDGRVHLNVDGGRATFDTSPLTVPHSAENDFCDDEYGEEVGEGGSECAPYRESLDNRGEYFMGCEEPMNATCGAGLGTDNPFGDGVHWPPPGRGE